VRALEKQTAELRKQINETKELTDAERIRLQAARHERGSARARARRRAGRHRGTSTTCSSASMPGEESNPLQAINDAQSKLVAIQGTLTRGGAGYRLVEEALLKLQTKRLQISKDLADKAKQEGDERKKHAARARPTHW
jgi:hypothetical protein